MHTTQTEMGTALGNPNSKAQNPHAVYALLTLFSIVIPDMPIDPNEPLYCYCQQISYGEMVACDNTDVSLISN